MPSARRSGCSCCSCGTRTRSTSCTRTRRPSGAPRAPGARPLGRVPRLNATVEGVRERLDDFDATDGRPGDRGVRRRPLELVRAPIPASFWDGSEAAFETLRTALVTTAQLLAPLCPFITDEIYDNLNGTEPSVHLTDFPEPGARDLELEQAMAVARETVRLGPCGPRPGEAQGPPAAAGRGRRRDRAERAAIERLDEIVRDELNVRSWVRVRGRRLGQVEVKPNYRTLGPRFGKQMPLVAAAVAGLDPPARERAPRGSPVSISIGGHDHELGADDLLVSMKPLEGYEVEREGSHAVALELAVDDELRAEGWAREIVHAVQTARRDAGLEVSDRIALTLDGDPELLAAARTHEPYIADEVLATASATSR